MSKKLDIHICITKKNPPKTVQVMEEDDWRKLNQECGDAACVLYSYYLSTTLTDSFSVTDTDVAKDIGWPIRKVQNTRRKLRKYKWIEESKGVNYAD